MKTRKPRAKTPAPAAPKAKTASRAPKKTKPKPGPKPQTPHATPASHAPPAAAAEPAAAGHAAEAPETKTGASSRAKVPITLEWYQARIREGIEKCDEYIEKGKKDGKTGSVKGGSVKPYKSLRRIFNDLLSKAPKLAKSKNRRRAGGSGDRSSGLMTEKAITPEFAAFLQLPPGETISRVDGTRAVNAYIHIKPDETRAEVLKWEYLNPERKRNLQNPTDKRIIEPDAVLTALLGYEDYKKDVAEGRITEQRKNKLTGEKEAVQITSDALYYRTVQKLIQQHFV